MKNHENIFEEWLARGLKEGRRALKEVLRFGVRIVRSLREHGHVNSS